MANPYSLLQQNRPQGMNYKTYDRRGHMSPNFEYCEGVRPTGEFMPAPYLPAIRFNAYFEEYVVLSGGKVVAFDSNGFIVPAGLKKELAAGVAGATVFYTDMDVSKGTRNAQGNLVAAGEPVVQSMIAAGITVSSPIGISSYNYWPHPGGDGVNPADYNTMNFNLQHRVAFVTDYVVQVPMVPDKAAYDAAIWKGMGVLVGVGVKPGMFVTFDNDSNFKLLGYDVGATDMGEVIGQVLTVDLEMVKDYLDRVRTRYTEFGELEKMPGTATGGVGHQLQYSGGYGLAVINLINR